MTPFVSLVPQTGAQLLRGMRGLVSGRFGRPASDCNPSSPAEKTFASHDRLNRLRIKAACIHRDRQARAQFFPEGIFGEPAWDILLHLFATGDGHADRSGRQAAPAFPSTVELRWIRHLSSIGLVAGYDDSEGADLAPVTLTNEGEAAIVRYLEAHIQPRA